MAVAYPQEWVDGPGRSLLPADAPAASITLAASAIINQKVAFDQS